MTTTGLEPLEPGDYAWGGDGSDPFEPIRAHVLAALRSTDQPYPAPLDQLLSLGSALEQEPDQAFQQIQFVPEQADDLVRMARDRALHTAPSISTEVWAPIWAAKALGRIGASDRAADLVPLLDLDDDGNAGFLSEVFSSFGEPALAPLAAYVQDHTRWTYSRTQAIELIDELVDAHPELRDRVVQIYTTALKDATNNESVYNGMLLAGLLQLKAIESLPVIRQAFEDQAIELEIAGDWPEVLEELGLPVDPSDPLVQEAYERADLDQSDEWAASPALQQTNRPKAAQSASQKNKANQKKRKRKAAAASRKANKKHR